MAPNAQELQKLLTEKQWYFLPYYRALVERYPEGIPAADAKAQIAQQLLEDFDINIFDAEQSGLNRSTQASRADQWANNLVSNHVLDDYMLVVRSTRAFLYPGVADNSAATPPPTSASLTRGEIDELNARRPVTMEAGSGSSSSSTFQRSLQLAEHVRGLTGHKCVVGKGSCGSFQGRDGKPYVEVHHIVPMANQDDIEINLDRTQNMVPLCPTCHAALHRGSAQAASAVLQPVLQWFQFTYGATFQGANNDLGIDVSEVGLLGMYGLATVS